ncbi:Smr domain-containing protein [Dioscorea alata]|uniref:Smr domain-containing protein n=1 Tax=Dioscorea alata TaxID=55571 RepID=A0ACB7W4C3_DIOAL|nr:Smr domain-containing protein [Dioscorea alata]
MKPSKKNAKRRRKASKSSAAAPAAPAPSESMEETLVEEKGALDRISETLASVSLDRITVACETGGEPCKAAEILGAQLQNAGGDRVVEKKGVGPRRRSRVVAASGMVSDVIGKGYSKHVGNSCEGRKDVVVKKVYRVEEAEQFLCSMLGWDDQLGMGVVKDVLGQCGYDVEKALDALIDISAPYCSQFNKNLLHPSQFTDKTSDSIYHPPEKEYEFLQSVGYVCRDYTSVFTGSKVQPLPGSIEKTDMQQKILESLFSIPGSQKHDPKCMDWKNVVKKVESFGKGLEFCCAGGKQSPPDAKKDRVGNKEAYQVFRSPAQVHYDTMKTYYQKAAAAYASGQWAHAAHLSEQGKHYSLLAREADERASRDIFHARNKDIKNAVTIDLHGQHVKNAIGLLKLHLLLFAYIPSVHFLKVITGCGADGVGKGKIKRSVINLVEKEEIQWSEENSGTLLLCIDGRTEYKFQECDSDTD